MRTTKIWTISLPPALERQAYRLAHQEHRTKSEFVREAVRAYLATRRWQSLQQTVAARARRQWPRREAEIEGLVDELRH